MVQSSNIFYAIIKHPTRPLVLLLKEPSGWNLPCFEMTGAHAFQDVANVNKTVSRQLNISVTTLRCISYDCQGKNAQMVYELENHDPDWTPPTSSCWLPYQALHQIVLINSEHRKILGNWFRETEDTAPSPVRVPWYVPGWSDKAHAWIQNQLEHLGVASLTSVQQLRSWQRSSVWRVYTDRGDFYFKAVPPVFAHEIPVTIALANRYPCHLPNTLVVDLDENFLLMEDMRGKLLNKVNDVTKWEDALRRYANIQIDQVPFVSELRQIGCPEQGLRNLAGQAGDELFGEHSLFGRDQLNRNANLNTTELRHLIPQLKKLCARLADYGVPYTLEHGDFHDHNIMVADGRCVFFDWSDSCISHPFFSVVLFFNYNLLKNSSFQKGSTSRRLLDVYLEPWRIYESRKRLWEIFELSQAVAPLYYLVQYLRWILPNIENKWELEAVVDFWLKILTTQKHKFFKFG